MRNANRVLMIAIIAIFAMVAMVMVSEEADATTYLNLDDNLVAAGDDVQLSCDVNNTGNSVLFRYWEDKNNNSIPDDTGPWNIIILIQDGAPLDEDGATDAQVVYTWTTPAFGDYNILVNATDQGDLSQAQADLLIDNIDPVIDHTPDYARAYDPGFKGNFWNHTNYTVTATVTDTHQAPGTYKVYYSIDGSPDTPIAMVSGPGGYIVNITNINHNQELKYYIEVFDQAGNKVLDPPSVGQYHTAKIDLIGPSIIHTPLTGNQSLGDYDIEATIIDSPTAWLNDSSLTVYYRLNGGAYTPIPMLLVSGTQYQATIPQQPHGTVIDYYIKAEDYSTNMTRHPALPSPYHRFYVDEYIPGIANAELRPHYEANTLCGFNLTLTFNDRVNKSVTTDIWFGRNSPYKDTKITDWYWDGDYKWVGNVTDSTLVGKDFKFYVNAIKDLAGNELLDDTSINFTAGTIDYEVFKVTPSYNNESISHGDNVRFNISFTNNMSTTDDRVVTIGWQYPYDQYALTHQASNLTAWAGDADTTFPDPGKDVDMYLVMSSAKDPNGTFVLFDVPFKFGMDRTNPYITDVITTTDTTIKITFNEILDDTTVEKDDWWISTSGSPPIYNQTADPVTDDNIVTLTVESMPTNATPTVYLKSGHSVADLVGRRLDGNTSNISREGIKPVITDFELWSPDKEPTYHVIPIGAEVYINLTFSEEMNTTIAPLVKFGTAADNPDNTKYTPTMDVDLTKGWDEYPEPGANKTWRGVFIVLEEYVEENYTFWIGKIDDRAYNMMEADYNQTVFFLIDTARPGVKESEMAIWSTAVAHHWVDQTGGVLIIGAHESGKNVSFKIKFNDTMTISDPKPTVSFAGGGSLQTGTPFWSGIDVLTIGYMVPYNSNKDDLPVTLTIAKANTKDKGGNMMAEPFIFSFIVDTKRPKITGVEISPMRNGEYVKGDDITFTIDFDENMDQSILPNVYFTNYSGGANCVLSYGGTKGWTDSNTWQGTYDTKLLNVSGLASLVIAGAEDFVDHAIITNDSYFEFVVDRVKPVVSEVQITPSEQRGFLLAVRDENITVSVTFNDDYGMDTEKSPNVNFEGKPVARISYSGNIWTGWVNVTKWNWTEKYYNITITSAADLAWNFMDTDTTMILEVDYSPPALNYSVAISNVTVIVNFTEELDPNSVEPDDFSFSAGTYVIDSAIAYKGNVTLTINYTTEFPTGNLPNLRFVGAVNDTLGNVYDPTGIPEINIIDLSPPKISKVVTGGSRYGNNTNGDKISVVFSESVNMTEIDTSPEDYFTVTGYIIDSIETHDYWLSIVLDEEIDNWDARPTVTLNNNIWDSNGNWMSHTSVEFQVDSPNYYDGLAPQFKSANTYFHTDGKTYVLVNFTSAIEDASLGDFLIDGELASAINEFPTTFVRLQFDGLKAGQTPLVSIKSGETIMDSSGNELDSANQLASVGISADDGLTGSPPSISTSSITETETQIKVIFILDTTNKYGDHAKLDASTISADDFEVTYGAITYQIAGIPWV